MLGPTFQIKKRSKIFRLAKTLLNIKCINCGNILKYKLLSKEEINEKNKKEFLTANCKCNTINLKAASAHVGFGYTFGKTKSIDISYNFQYIENIRIYIIDYNNNYKILLYGLPEYITKKYDNDGNLYTLHKLLLTVKDLHKDIFRFKDNLIFS